jgi:hypothetical protein
MRTEDAEKLPRAGQVLPHSQRAALDRANHARGAGHGDLTDDERARGLRRPRWHSYMHVPCGTVSDLRFDDAAETLAREPDRPIYRAKGLYCLRCQDLFPIEGDLQRRPGEFFWIDTAGNLTPVKVGL